MDDDQGREIVVTATQHLPASRHVQTVQTLHRGDRPEIGLRNMERSRWTQKSTRPSFRPTIAISNHLTSSIKSRCGFLQIFQSKFTFKSWGGIWEGKAICFTPLSCWHCLMIEVLPIRANAFQKHPRWTVKRSHHISSWKILGGTSDGHLGRIHQPPVSYLTIGLGGFEIVKDSGV